jgi:hypothetical protein
MPICSNSSPLNAKSPIVAITVEGAGSKLAGKKPTLEKSSHSITITVGKISPFVQFALERFLRFGLL